jgi:hypothetical protein
MLMLVFRGAMACEVFHMPAKPQARSDLKLTSSLGKRDPRDVRSLELHRSFRFRSTHLPQGLQPRCCRLITTFPSPLCDRYDD